MNSGAREESGFEDTRKLTISILETRTHSVVFKVTYNGSWPVFLTEDGRRCFVRCINGSAFFPHFVRVARDDNYPAYKFQDPPTDRKKEHNYCYEKDYWHWNLRERLEMLDAKNYTYEVHDLLEGSMYELFVDGDVWPHMPWNRLDVMKPFYTESLDPPIVKQGYFWIRSSGTSSSERLVTIFWQKHCWSV